MCFMNDSANTTNIHSFYINTTTKYYLFVEKTKHIRSTA